MFVIDTSVLVLACNRDSEGHAPCLDLLQASRARPDAWYLTWPVIYEFLRVVTHPRVLASPLDARDAWRFVEALLASPSLGLLTPSERHASVVSEVLRSVPAPRGNLMHDVHTVVLMREHGIRRIVTRDADFRRFPGITVQDPLDSSGGRS